jgi:hypothetical protein
MDRELIEKIEKMSEEELESFLYDIFVVARKKVGDKGLWKVFGEWAEDILLSNGGWDLVR